MKKVYETVNGIVIDNPRAMAKYLNTIAETFVITDFDLDNPCYVYVDDNRKINIDAYGYDVPNHSYGIYPSVYEAWDDIINILRNLRRIA